VQATDHPGIHKREVDFCIVLNDPEHWRADIKWAILLPCGDRW